MAVIFKVCRLSELTFSGPEARCQEIDYKLYDDSVTDESSATIRKYKGGCVFNISEFRELNWNGAQAPRDVVDIMQVFLRCSAMNKVKRVENEIRFLWDNGIVAGLAEFCEDSAYDEVISFYARCLRTTDSGFLEFVIEQLKTAFCWSVIEWDAQRIILFLRWVDFTKLTPTGAEALMEFLKKVKAANKCGEVFDKILNEMLQIKESSVRDAVVLVFVNHTTEKRLLSGILRSLELLRFGYDDVIFQLLGKCSLSLLRQQQVLVHLAELGGRPHFDSARGILKGYLTVFKDDIHMSNDEPLLRALLCDDSMATDFLIFQGADIRRPLATIKALKNPLDNAAIRSAKKFEKLHNILRGRKTLKETAYHKYYGEGGCVKAAERIGATFAQIQTAYDFMHPRDPATGKEKKRHIL